MTNNKISPELNIAISVSEDERKKSLDLNVGYDDQFQEWELIIRHTGNLDEIRSQLGIVVEELLGGYAIVRIPQNMIGQLSDYSQITYIEKPKSLLIEEMKGIAASCINPVYLPPYSLTGKGTLVACLDSGVDYTHPDFRNADGTTRIVAMWDQTTPGNPPSGFFTGSEYEASDINVALESDSGRVPEFDATGHGTAVLGIMGGNGHASNGNIVGVAPDADLLVVKLGSPIPQGFPRTTQLMLAIDYAVKVAIDRNEPLAINISYGNHYGAHNGDSVLERYLDNVSGLHKISIAAGTGNDGISGRHAAGTISRNQEKEIEINVSDYVNSFNLQIWKPFTSDFEIELQTPQGYRIGPFSPYAQTQTYNLQEQEISIYYSEPTPFNAEQEIYISFIPANEYISSGIWKIRLQGNNDGRYAMWLPVAGSTSGEVSFLQATQYNTLVIPSTARYVISVSAYDSGNDTFADFSGRGSLEKFEGQASYKPDLAAPGVAINTCSVGGGYGVFSGTSFSAPFVTGSAALLMQYGIVEGKDPYMYGEKIRAVLQKGARKLPFQENTPSALVGWGALCLYNSFFENGTVL